MAEEEILLREVMGIIEGFTTGELKSPAHDIGYSARLHNKGIESISNSIIKKVRNTTSPDLKLIGDEEIISIVREAFKKDALLEHFVEGRGHWERIITIVAQAQLDSCNKQLADIKTVKGE